MAGNDGIDARIDHLSPIGARIVKFNQPSAYHALVVKGQGNLDARAILENLKPADLLSAPIVDHDAAAGVLAGLWLWHDWLDESHRICQAIETPTGSFWHAIMHRREGDFSNSKYWFARVVDHPAYPSIANIADAVLDPLPVDNAWVRLTHGGWRPERFVDLVESAHDAADNPRLPVLVNLQQLEGRMLFDYGVRTAVGK